MKKAFAFFSALIVTTTCLFCSAFASTTSISLTSAKPDGARSFVDVSGTITGVSDSQQITYLITEVNGEEYDYENLSYINQTVYTDADGAFSFQLGVKDTLDANKVYVVRIGGSNVSEPASLIVGTNSGGEVSFVIGDVNGDGQITVADASIALQYILNPNSVDSAITSREDFEKRINVTGKEDITAEQVACILQKALNSSFKFPTENKK